MGPQPCVVAHGCPRSCAPRDAPGSCSPARWERPGLWHSPARKLRIVPLLLRLGEATPRASCRAGTHSGVPTWPQSLCGVCYAEGSGGELGSAGIGSCSQLLRRVEHRARKRSSVLRWGRQRDRVPGSSSSRALPHPGLFFVPSLSAFPHLVPAVPAEQCQLASELSSSDGSPPSRGLRKGW